MIESTLIINSNKDYFYPVLLVHDTGKYYVLFHRKCCGMALYVHPNSNCGYSVGDYYECWDMAKFKVPENLDKLVIELRNKND